MKFKNKKKKVYVKKSPSNSRTIPANLKFSLPKFNHTALLKIYSGVLQIFVIIVFIAAVIIVGLDFHKNLQISQEIDSQRKTLVRDLKFWENFISEHQNYRDAYLQASILEYKLGDTSKAKMYAEKGLVLDPNSEIGRKIEEFLKNKFYF